MRLGTIKAAGATLLALAVGSCTDQEESVEAGARLLEASFTEEYWIGDEPTERQFADVTAVAFTPDGELVVMDRGEFAVTVLTGNGTEVVRWGRKGQGPGEFVRTLGNLAVSGEATLAIDNARRVQVFTLTGKVLESHRMSGAIMGLAFDGEGGPVASTLRMDPTRFGESMLERVVRLADGEVLWESEPLPPMSAYQMFPRHGVLSDLGSGRLAVGMSDEYDMAVLDASTGTTLHHVKRNVAYRGPSDDYKNEYRQSVVRPSVAPEFAEQLTFGERFTVIRSMFTGPPGHTIWLERGGGIEDEVAHPPVQRLRSAGDPPRPQRYDLFDGDTYEYIGTVEVAPRLRLMAGDRERVAGVQSDEQGVHSVRVLRVEVERP